MHCQFVSLRGCPLQSNSETYMTEPDKTYAGGLLQPTIDPFESYCLSMDDYQDETHVDFTVEIIHGPGITMDRRGYTSQVPARRHQVGALVFLEQAQTEKRAKQRDLKVKWLTHVGLCLERADEGEQERLRFQFFNLDHWVPAAPMYEAQPALTTNGLARRAVSSGSNVEQIGTDLKLSLRVLSPHAALTARQLVAAYAAPEIVSAFWTYPERQALSVVRDQNKRHREYVEQMVADMAPAEAA